MAIPVFYCMLFLLIKAYNVIIVIIYDYHIAVAKNLFCIKSFASCEFNIKLIKLEMACTGCQKIKKCNSLKLKILNFKTFDSQIKEAWRLAYKQ